MLVEWLGLPPEDCSWEELGSIFKLDPTTHLEDKVRIVGRGDVTIILDQ